MKHRLLKILGIILQIIGALALVVVAIFVDYLPWSSNPRIDQITAEDAKFVLDRAGIGDKSKIQRVLHSYESPDHITGDCINAYCLQIDRFPDEVLQKGNSEHKVWLIPPIENALLVEALKTSSTMAAHWFPSAEMLNSNRFYLSFSLVVARHQRVNEVELTAYDREERKLYYVYAKY